MYWYESFEELTVFILKIHVFLEIAVCLCVKNHSPTKYIRHDLNPQINGQFSQQTSTLLMEKLCNYKISILRLCTI